MNEPDEALLDEQLLAPLVAGAAGPVGLAPESVRLDVSELMLPDALVKQASGQLEQRRRLERLRATALESCERVKPHISSKVLADYDERLKVARTAFKPVREQLVARLKLLREVESSLRQRRQELEDHLDELRFRSSVGEFDTERLAELEREQDDLKHELALKIDLIESTYDTARSVLDGPIEQLVDEVTQRIKKADVDSALNQASAPVSEPQPPAAPVEPTRCSSGDR